MLKGKGMCKNEQREKKKSSGKRSLNFRATVQYLNLAAIAHATSGVGTCT